MGDNHLAAIEVDVAKPPAGFVSGATVGVDVAVGDSQGFSVPAAALLEGETRTWVFVVDAQEKVHPVQVQVLARSADRVAVTGDALRTGAAVIVARPSRLMTFTEGMQVTVSDNQEGRAR